MPSMTPTLRPVTLNALKLTTRTRRALSSQGIDTLKTLLTRGPMAVRLLRGIGPERFLEIEQAFHTGGISWGEDVRRARLPRP